MFVFSLLKASHLWSPEESGTLLRVPHDERLCSEAKASILYATQSHSSVSDSTEPRVIFGRASRFKQSKGTIVCSPRVADFYKGALMVNNRCGMPYIAALGVSYNDYSVR